MRHPIVRVAIALLLLVSSAAGVQNAPSAAATTMQSSPSPRQLVEQTVPGITSLLLDRSIPRQQRAARLQAILRQRIDFVALSRLMLGQPWDGFTAQQRQGFVGVFSDYLVSVYEPLMDLYSGQQVSVSDDQPVGKGDYTVVTRVTDQKGGHERQIALIASRFRQGEQGWMAIDVTVEGISVARVFGAQFRPVLARDGIDGLTRQLRDKTAASRAAPSGS